MKTERELFEVEMEKLIGKVLSIKYSEEEGGYVAHKLMISDESTKMIVNVFNFSWAIWQASASREGYKLMPCNPTEEMWGGLARHFVKYMQSHDRYCPKTLGKYINRFIGFKNIPDWLNKEIPDWDSDHAFATADLPVFIYKAMLEAVEK